MEALSDLWVLLRCLECGGRLQLGTDPVEHGYPELGPDALLVCERCTVRFPVIAGTARMLSRQMLERLHDQYPRSASVLIASGLSRQGETDISGDVLGGETRVRDRTAESFGYVWQRFSDLEPESQVRFHFRQRMRPHPPELLGGWLVLDVGSGSGINSRLAGDLGASVVAVDLSSAIDVTRASTPPSVLTVQADAERLPFEHGTFDFVMSMGVLHHLPDTERALRSIAAYARPNCHVHIYLYWMPTRRWHRLVLAGVKATHAVTSRLPSRVVHLFCYPAAALSWLLFVGPYRLLRGRRRARRIAGALPLKAYADTSSTALVGALFDYLHTPIQTRFTREQVVSMMTASQLTDVEVIADNGWIADGRRCA